ncbi:hypothetical protein OS493_016274 [Desmophyllum pertusum]|uniref:Alternative oxidase n=1 Tax=Desmophyllum pertusum TaxID=174260 RepID=A0A9X0A230_9CNID|nr:hypothetical protein OS493_016274 [Desmophyllum pertusum]
MEKPYLTFIFYVRLRAVRFYLCIDDETLPIWSTRPAPTLAVNYWKLKEGAVMRDAILAIRADEAHHRVVNHTLSSMHLNEKNPFSPGQKKIMSQDTTVCIYTQSARNTLSQTLLSA